MLTFLMSALLFVGDPPSGPKVGEKLGDAKVKGIFEPIEGKEFNLLDRAKKEKATLEKNIAASEKEIEQIKAKYDLDRKRWLALKNVAPSK